MGNLDWNPDKGLGASGASATDLAGQGQGHSRQRNKSYSSTDLLWSQQLLLGQVSDFTALSLSHASCCIG